MIYREEIVLTKEEAEFYSEIMRLTGEEIYDKYGMKRDEDLWRIAYFDNDYEAALRIVVGDWDEYPFAEMILFNGNGGEVSVSDTEDEIMGSWYVYDGETKYEVEVKTKEV